MFATRLHFPCFNCEDQWEDSSPLILFSFIKAGCENTLHLHKKKKTKNKKKPYSQVCKENTSLVIS